MYILFLKFLLKVTSEFLVKPNHSAPFIAWHHLVCTVKGSSTQSATHGSELGCQLLPVLAKVSTEIDSKCLQTFQAIWHNGLTKKKNKLTKQTNWGLYTDEFFSFHTSCNPFLLYFTKVLFTLFSKGRGTPLEGLRRRMQGSPNSTRRQTTLPGLHWQLSSSSSFWV